MDLIEHERQINFTLQTENKGG